MGRFVFNAVDLSQTFEVVEVVTQAVPTISLDLRQSFAMDGAAIAGKRLEPLEITITARMATSTIDERDIQEALAVAVAPLVTSEPKPLYLVAGKHRMAILTDATTLEFASYSAKVQLKFLCADPVAYGATRTVTVPSGGSVSVSVGGTYPTSPAISASAVRSSSSLVWGLKLDNQDHLHIATGSASARAIVADCSKRTLTVAGATALPTLDSDWLSLSPGTHTLANDQGTGAATVTFVERWL